MKVSGLNCVISHIVKAVNKRLGLLYKLAGIAALCAMLPHAKAQNLVPNAEFEERNRFQLLAWKQPGKQFYHYENKMIVRNGKMRYEWVNGLCLVQPSGSEYMLVKLNEPLVSGETYHLSMDVLINTPSVGYIPRTAIIPHFHVHFTDSAYQVFTRTKIYTDNVISFDISKLNPSDSFTRVSTAYTAQGHEKYLLIGNFFPEVMLEKDYWTNEYNMAKGGVLAEYTRLSMAPPGKMEFDLKKAMKQADKRGKKYDKWYKRQLDSLDKIYSKILNEVPNVELAQYDTRLYFDNILLVAEKNYSEELELEDEDKPEFEENTYYRFNFVVFETNRSTLLPQSFLELDYVVQILNKYQEFAIELTGHTDSINTDAYNMRLSVDRAKACAEYMIKKGIDAKRITYFGKGEEEPIAPNDTEEGRQMNRRVEFLLRRM